MDLFLILAGAIFVNNFVLVQFLGMCPFFGVSSKLKSAVGMGLAVTMVMVIASVLTYIFNVYVLIPFDMSHLTTISFILIIASIVQFIEMFMRKYLVILFSLLGLYLPLITTNCAILGVVIINSNKEYNFLQSLVNSFGAGVGFTLAIVLLSTLREKYEDNPNIPNIFRGLPFALFAAGLMSLAFMGFNGIV